MASDMPTNRRRSNRAWAIRSNFIRTLPFTRQLPPAAGHRRSWFGFERHTDGTKSCLVSAIGTEVLYGLGRNPCAPLTRHAKPTLKTPSPHHTWGHRHVKVKACQHVILNNVREGLYSSDANSA